MLYIFIPIINQHLFQIIYMYSCYCAFAVIVVHVCNFLGRIVEAGILLGKEWGGWIYGEKYGPRFGWKL